MTDACLERVRTTLGEMQTHGATALHVGWFASSHAIAPPTVLPETVDWPSLP